MSFLALLGHLNIDLKKEGQIFLMKKIIFEFLYQNHFLGKFRHRTNGKKTNLGQKMFLRGNGAPSAKNFGHLKVSPEFLNYKSLEPHIRPRHIVWELE